MPTIFTPFFHAKSTKNQAMAPDPDPQKFQSLDPDPHKMDADPKPCMTHP